jgi:hypothetical protein
MTDGALLAEQFFPRDKIGCARFGDLSGQLCVPLDSANRNARSDAHSADSVFVASGSEQHLVSASFASCTAVIARRQEGAEQ